MVILSARLSSLGVHCLRRGAAQHVCSPKSSFCHYHVTNLNSQESWRRRHLKQLWTLLGRRLGVRACSPIVPLVVGSEADALAAAAALLAAGFYVPAIRPPTVPAGASR